MKGEVKPVRNRRDFEELKEGDLVESTEGGVMVCGWWRNKSKRLYSAAGVEGREVYAFRYEYLNRTEKGLVTPREDEGESLAFPRQKRKSDCLLQLGSKEYNWALYLLKRAEVIK